MVLVHGKPAARIFDQVCCLGDERVNFVSSGAAAVLIDGRPAARNGDAVFHGGEVVRGVPLVLIGGPEVEGWTVDGVRALLCAHDPSFVSAVQASGIQVFTLGPGAGHQMRYWDGGAWQDHFQEVYGYGGPSMQILVSQSNEDAVNTLYHEHYHVAHGHGYSARNEYETELATEQWAIDHGLPEGRPGFRRYDPASGRWVPDEDAIRSFVERTTGPLDPPPGAAASPGGTERIVRHNPANSHAVVSRDDGTHYERPPRTGDFYRVEGTEVTPLLHEVPLEWLSCS
jgi:hypothetical protein